MAYLRDRGRGAGRRRRPAWRRRGTRAASSAQVTPPSGRTSSCGDGTQRRHCGRTGSSPETHRFISPNFAVSERFGAQFDNQFPSTKRWDTRGALFRPLSRTELTDWLDFLEGPVRFGGARRPRPTLPAMPAMTRE